MHHLEINERQPVVIVDCMHQILKYSKDQQGNSNYAMQQFFTGICWCNHIYGGIYHPTSKVMHPPIMWDSQVFSRFPRPVMI